MIYRIIVLVIALCSSSISGWSAERFPFLGEVISDKVSIRAGQDVNFERVDLISKGTDLLVLEKHYDWYKIQLPSTAKAYIRVDYLKIINGKVAQVAADRVNVRAGRGVNFTVLGQLTKGVTVRLVTKFDDWFQIEPVEGLYGWVHKDFIKVKSYEIPSLDALGLAPIVEETVSLEDAPIVHNAVSAVSVNPVSEAGVIEPVSPNVALSNIQYQFITADKTVYYLKIDPAIVGNFTRNPVRLEGEPVSSGSSSLEHIILLVKKINLIF